MYGNSGLKTFLKMLLSLSPPFKNSIYPIPFFFAIVSKGRSMFYIILSVFINTILIFFIHIIINCCKYKNNF